MMIVVVTFPYLYTIYGLIIGFVCFSVNLAQIYNSKRLLHCLCTICAILSIYLPIFLKFHCVYTRFADALVSIFSAVTGFLFAMKIMELAFTYPWLKQKQITIKQILIDFSTFPKYKYEEEPSSIPPTNLTLFKCLHYLIFNSNENQFSARQENFLLIIRGLFQLICLRVLLHFTPYSVLRLHSQQAQFFSVKHFLTYSLYGFVFYFALGMVINTIFGLMGGLWNIRVRTIYPGYPFLPVGLHDFWSRRWNIYVKSILHRIALVALPKLTGFKEKSNGRIISAGVFAFVMSGLLHEFMYTVSMNRWSGGKNMIFFLLHGIFVGIELFLKRLFHREQFIPPVIGWLYTIAALYFTAFLFCDPWIESDCFATLKTHLG